MIMKLIVSTSFLIALSKYLTESNFLMGVGGEECGEGWAQSSH